MLDGWSKEEVRKYTQHLDELRHNHQHHCDTVRLVVANQNKYGEVMKERVQQLRSDGIC